MAKVSVLIPSRNEQFMPQTVADILGKAAGDIEVIVVLEGYWPDPMPEDDPRLIFIHTSQPRGMREAINSAASVATGDWFMKCDAHCMFAEGFDEVLKSECDQDWVMIPRRYSLDPENWRRKPRTPIDYHYLGFPLKGERKGTGSLHGRWWRQRGKDRAEFLIDDEMSSQGSCWFMSRRHYWDFLGGLSVFGYGDFIQEFQEVGGKTWLGGGQVKINKKTWYAHLHKGNTYGRGYFIRKGSWAQGLSYSSDLWLNNRWEGRIHDFVWLVDKFAPVPTWPEDYHSLWKGTEWVGPEING